MTDEHALERQLLALPLAARARLANRLIASLDDNTDAVGAEAVWLDEARKRALEHEQNPVGAIPLADAMQQAFAQLK